MSENKHFDKALSDMKDNFAGRGGIAHLADLGYPVLEIQSSLDFPFPLEKIGRVMWEHFVSNETILLKAPGSGAGKENATYIRKTDAYGRQSFIRTDISDPDRKETTWTKTVLRIDHDIFTVKPSQDEKIIRTFLRENSHGGPDYVSLDFGRLKSRNGTEWLTLLTVEGGDCSGIPIAGDSVRITADDPPAGQVFDHWEVVSGGVTLDDPNSPETEFIVGNEDVTVKAVFIHEKDGFLSFSYDTMDKEPMVGSPIMISFQLNVEVARVDLEYLTEDRAG